MNLIVFFEKMRTNESTRSNQKTEGFLQMSVLIMAGLETIMTLLSLFSCFKVSITVDIIRMMNFHLK